MSGYLPEHLTVELILKRTVFEARAYDVLGGLDVEAEVVCGELGGQELVCPVKQLLGCNIEGGRGQGGQRVQ